MLSTSDTTVEAGDLRKRMVLQTMTGTTRDSYGQVTQVWTDTATYWAQLKPFQSRKITVAGQVESLISHSVRMRFIPGVGISPANNRFRLGNRLFSIIGILDVEEMHVTWEISVTEIER